MAPMLCPPPSRKVSPEEVCALLGSVVLPRRSSALPVSLSVPFLRLAAAHRASILASRPDLWRATERFYRQQLRPALPSAEARHWDGALRVEV